MKNILYSLPVLMFLNMETYSQVGVGIGTTTPAASAALDVSSTTRGLLPPRMTAAQRNAIATPANGLIVFDTDSAALMVRSAGGWRRLTTTATPGGFWSGNGTNIFNLNTGNTGIGTNNPLARLHVADSSVLFSGLTTNSLTPAIPPPMEGPGIRMLWYPQKAAFRAGFAGFNTWDRDNIGTHSFAGGQGTLARGRSSTAFGLGTEATGDFSTATGISTRSRAFGSIAVGAYNNAEDNPNPVTAAPEDRIFQIGNGSAENVRRNALTVLRNGRVGIGTTSPLAALHIADSNVLFFAPGLPSFPTTSDGIDVEGRRLLWYPRKAAFRVGYGGAAWYQDSIGLYSFASGSNTKALGYGSTALGIETVARGDLSTAMGLYTIAGAYATAMGVGANAIGHSSVAMGFETRSIGSSSIAMGRITTAEGEYSLSAGYYTSTKAFGGVVFGTYNNNQDIKSDPFVYPPPTTERLFQIGNGTADTDRRNALTVQRNGRMGLGTTSPLARLHVADSSVVFTSMAPLPTIPGNTPVSGTGHRMMWYADKGAFRAGYAFNDAWDKDNIGYGSVALGGAGIATGNYSVALNANTSATGGGATAAGWGTSAKAIYSFALGSYNDITDNPAPNTATATDRLFQIGNGTISVRNNALTLLRNGNMGLGNVNSPNAPLQFSNTPQSRKIVFYENVNNDHQFIGFGVDGLNIGGPFGIVGGVLRYQTDAIGTDHVFYSAASAAASNELLRIKGNGNVGIGAAGTNAPLQFANTTVNRKIVLYEGANNDHQYYGFGINSGVLRYQTDALAADHVFYSAASASASNELLRIKGNGNIGINQPNPGVYGHGGTARVLEIWNNSGVDNDVQSHLVLSTSGSGGSMGGVTWATTALGGEQKAAFVGAAYESGSNNALFQVLLRRNGSLAQRFRVNSDGSAFLQGSLTQNSDATLKKNIESISNATDLLVQLHGYRYQWKDENAYAEKQLGLLAQEVQKVLPELVKEGENGKLGVNYTGLIPVLLEALKEQRNEIETLKTLVSQLINSRK